MIARIALQVNASGAKKYKVFRIDSIEIVENVNKSFPLKIPKIVIPENYGDDEAVSQIFDMIKIEEMITVTGYIDRTSILEWDGDSAHGASHYQPGNDGALFTYAHEVLNELRGIITGNILSTTTLADASKSLVCTFQLLPDTAYTYDLADPSNDCWNAVSSTKVAIGWTAMAYLQKLQANIRYEQINPYDEGLVSFYDLKIVILKAKELEV